MAVPLKLTTSGSWPLVGVALTETTGARLPFTYSNRSMAASGLMLKNPSP